MATSQRPLGIPKFRRVLGASAVLLMYAAAAIVCARRFLVVRSPEVSPQMEIRAFVVLVCAIISTPYILMPCLLDRFPKWIAQTMPADSLRYITHWFFGLKD
jgi:hypothetical protein